MANEKRLIYLEDVLDDLHQALEDAKADQDPFSRHVEACLDVLIKYFEHFPTVDAVEVVHGRWLDVKETSLYVPDRKYTVTHTAETCSACKVRIGFVGAKQYLFDAICPNCGAKMLP